MFRKDKHLIQDNDQNLWSKRMSSIVGIYCAFQFYWQLHVLRVGGMCRSNRFWELHIQYVCMTQLNSLRCKTSVFILRARVLQTDLLDLMCSSTFQSLFFLRNFAVEAVSHYAFLDGWNSLCGQGYSLTHRDLPAYASQVLRLRACTTMPGLQLYILPDGINQSKYLISIYLDSHMQFAYNNCVYLQLES